MIREAPFLPVFKNPAFLDHFLEKTALAKFRSLRQPDVQLVRKGVIGKFLELAERQQNDARVV